VKKEGGERGGEKGKGVAKPTSISLVFNKKAGLVKRKGVE